MFLLGLFLIIFFFGLDLTDENCDSTINLTESLGKIYSSNVDMLHEIFNLRTIPL
jgi:hypothetical protein